MKTYLHLFLSLCILVLCASCGKKTEKFASKEHGMKFNSWEMHYRADEYDVYWPTVRLSEPAEGTLNVVKQQYSYFGKRLAECDTINSTAFFKSIIYSVKSKNDAKYYNKVYIQVNGADNRFWPGLEHHFTFNKGQKDSVSFSLKADNDVFKLSRESSEKVIQLLSQKKPVNVMVTFTGSSVEGVYDFTIDGEPKLKKALELNEKRKIQAQKEFDKEDAKMAKMMEDILF